MKTDCHAHVIDPERFPYIQAGGYIPKENETGTAAEYRLVLKKNDMGRGLLVQPSCYAFDNSAMLDATAQDPQNLRGIAVVDLSVTAEQAAQLKEQGVVGVRLNVGSFDPKFFERPEAGRFVKKVAEFGWFLQVYASASAWQTFGAMFLGSDVRLIIDHMGHPDVAAPTTQPGFEMVKRIGRQTNAVVKLSDAFRLSREQYPHKDVDRYATEVLEAFGVDRCLWGSDWPFINRSYDVKYEEQYACFMRWVTSPADRDKILSANPARLFGFET